MDAHVTAAMPAAGQEEHDTGLRRAASMMYVERQIVDGAMRFYLYRLPGAP